MAVNYKYVSGMIIQGSIQVPVLKSLNPTRWSNI